MFITQYIDLIHLTTLYLTQNFHVPLKIIKFYMYDTEETMHDISGAGKPKEYWCNVM